LIKLKHIINGAVVSEIDLSQGEFSIGRNHGNSLQLDDAVVSGQHAVITMTPNPYLPEVFDISIRDLGSTNGTYVNNALVKERDLRHGDSIRIGTYEYKVFDDQSNENTQTEYYIAEE
jgi:pSer/pThr/pTyr-binding forkhead associated (FHA) protein